jgi:hypothetical protein
MSTKLGSASRAREIANLFDAWRRAFDLQDHATMAVARRAIDAMVAGRTPSEPDVRAIENFIG